MRRLTVILMCAVCAVMNVAAQTVASSPTAVLFIAKAQT